MSEALRTMSGLLYVLVDPWLRVDENGGGQLSCNLPTFLERVQECSMLWFHDGPDLFTTSQFPALQISPP